MEQQNLTPDPTFMSEKINELAAALAKAQGEFTIAIPSGTNPRFKNRYCKMKDLVKASRPALEKNGLAVTMLDLRDEDGKRLLITVLTHISGQYFRSKTLIDPLDEKNAQSVVAYDTYMGRKCYKNITGVVCDDDGDDDGETAVAPIRSPYNNFHQSTSNRITTEQLESLSSLPETTRERILEFNKISSLNELTIEQYDKIMAMLKNRKQ
jgi:hypothetical protein